MLWLQIASCIVFPFVASTYVYAVTYGYKGRSRIEAWHDTKYTFVGASGLSAVLLMMLP